MQLCFLDESGSGDNPDGDRTATPAFVLVGVIVDSSHLPQLTREFLELKRMHFPARYQSPRALDHILIEVKGGEILRMTRGASRNHRRLAHRVRCDLVRLLARHSCRLVGRVWIKRPHQAMNADAAYCFTVQDVYRHFSEYLRQRQDTGVLLADGRTHRTNTQIAHAVFTQKWRTGGDAYPAVAEVPMFGASDNHAGLQIADLVASTLVFPMAVAAYCPLRPGNAHSSPRYAEVRTEFGTALRNMQFRYRDASGRWRGGLVVSDRVGQQNGSPLFAAAQELVPV